MAERERNHTVEMGDRPFRPIANIAKRPVNLLLLPELRIHVGRDNFSGGMTAYSWVRTEAPLPQRVTLVEQRWKHGPQSTLEAVYIAIQGLQWYLGEAMDVSE